MERAARRLGATVVNRIARRLHPQRLRRTVGAASCVRESARFIVNELRNVPSERRYHLRASDLLVHVRHPLLDMWVLEEIFRFRVYDPPPEAARALAAVDRPLRIVDVGGNVGLFVLFMRGLFPEASAVSFEPDPENARLLGHAIATNSLDGTWRLVEACAGTREATVEFASSFQLSRVAAGPAHVLEDQQDRIGRALPFLADTPLLRAERREVPVRDVFPSLVEADLVKVDAEGAEWELLADPRLHQLRAAAIVLEYHPPYGPGDEADETVRRALTGAGYVVGPPVRGDDTAVVWAWRDGGRSS